MEQLSHAFASFSVRDATRAQDFYKNILGLKTELFPMGESHLLNIEIGGEKFMLYEKKDHTPASFTVMNFEIPDIEAAVKELSSKGIKFERYAETDELGITRNDGPLIAWFKDPDGNFISLIQNEVAPPSPS